MLRQPVKKKGLILKSLGAVAIFEFVLCAGAFVYWKKLNLSQKERLSCRKNYPWMLETYYKVGETLDKNNQIRRMDEDFWREKGFIK